MASSEDCIGYAMDRYRRFKAENGIESAPEILVSTDHETLVGVGFEWKREGQGPLRNAFAFRNPEDAEEFRRRLTENP